MTGAAGRLARAVLPMLCGNARIERVTGIDRVAIGYAHPKLAPLRADIGDRGAHAALRGADALVNLAFVVLRGRMPLARMRATNVDATKALLAAAMDAGIASIVHLSSAAVYGHGLDVTEEAPLAPLPRFNYARHKAEVDAWIARTMPHAAVLRPTIVLGPNAHPLLTTLLGLPFYVRVADPQPRLSLVHEDDVAQAIVLALDTGAHGAFNLAAHGTFVVRDLVRARHRHASAVSPSLARVALHAAWRIAGWGGEPGWIDGASGSLTLDCGRARRALGWRPRYDDCESILATCARRALPRSGAPDSQNSE
jgi:UDP-glucose 4-epimerase